MARSHTQWAAQFAVGAELCRRARAVSFTMGNATPDADLMVAPSEGQPFLIDVKGLAKSNFWQIKPKPFRPQLFYVLCMIEAERLDKRPRFFVMTQRSVNDAIANFRSGLKRAPGPRDDGIPWGVASAFEDRWEVLPLSLGEKKGTSPSPDPPLNAQS